MNPAVASSEHDQNRRAITAHFTGHASPASESAMRAHLPTCPSCRRHYERHLLLAQLDPRGLPAQQRIARGLGFARPRRPWASGLAKLMVPAVAFAALAIFAASPQMLGRGGKASSETGGQAGDKVAHHNDPENPPDRFAARGGDRAVSFAPAFWTYRVGASGAPALAEAAVGAGDELAFAYSNPAGKPYLMIFGVDEHHHVYWFHPAWPTGQPPPVAVPAAPGPGPHELSGAIRHTVAGTQLNVYAIFADRAHDVTEVERALQAGAGDLGPQLGSGVVTVRRVFQVHR